MVIGSYFAASPIVRTRSSFGFRPSIGIAAERCIEDDAIVQIWPCGVRLPRYQSLGYVKNYYNSARSVCDKVFGQRQRIYPRYSEDAWNQVTKVATRNANNERSEAEQMRLETWRAIREANKRTKDMQNLSTQKLKNRMQDIEYWRNELSSEIRTMDQEQDKLKIEFYTQILYPQEKLRVMNMAKCHIQKPLRIAEECLINREGRQGIDEVKDAVERALNKTVQEIHETEKLVQLLTQSIEDKLKPLKVAETRLKERTKRHSMELCQDDPMKTLQCEAIELRTIIRALKGKLHQARLSQTRLQRNQETLQADIAIKENSLEIDQRCLNMRKTFPINDKRGTLFSVPVSY
ncbi:tektin-3 [Paragonimus westermani]|uniref:Tektin n=1 Tax=Paragonimus westermani TaxID=34504 RepID=A0A5J4NFL4_9TREM|nr:tektin-3 [Paragonimus westermani]